jgi:hypothetical protein
MSKLYVRIHFVDLIVFACPKINFADLSSFFIIVHICNFFQMEAFPMKENGSWWEQFIPEPRYITGKCDELLSVKIYYCTYKAVLFYVEYSHDISWNSTGSCNNV